MGRRQAVRCRRWSKQRSRDGTWRWLQLSAKRAGSAKNHDHRRRAVGGDAKRLNSTGHKNTPLEGVFGTKTAQNKRPLKKQEPLPYRNSRTYSRRTTRLSLRQSLPHVRQQQPCDESHRTGPIQRSVLFQPCCGHRFPYTRTCNLRPAIGRMYTAEVSVLSTDVSTFYAVVVLFHDVSIRAADVSVRRARPLVSARPRGFGLRGQNRRRETE